MQLEKRIAHRIENVFEMLSLPMRLLDAQGTCLLPAGQENFVIPARANRPQVNQRVGEFWLRALDVTPAVYLAAPAGVPGAEDILAMADVMIMTLFRDQTAVTPREVYLRVLSQELSGSDLMAASGEYQIPFEQDRCVVLFQLEQMSQHGSNTLLKDLIPLNDGDELVDVNRYSMALIKDMNDMDGMDEVVEYAQAVQSAAMEEGIQSVQVGVGDIKHTLGELGESYAEARRALDVGRVFKPGQSVHVFSRLMLERFLMNVSREESQHYHALLFNAENAKLFNEEMLQTIDMFFRKDLNLSDTARQLFIHRNTLVYRLDKVYKQTGLDLRRFDDAVTFKILYELKKCSQEKPRQIL